MDVFGKVESKMGKLSAAELATVDLDIGDGRIVHYVDGSFMENGVIVEGVTVDMIVDCAWPGLKQTIPEPKQTIKATVEPKVAKPRTPIPESRGYGDDS
jgi:hypothetical protein